MTHGAQIVSAALDAKRCLFLGLRRTRRGYEVSYLRPDGWMDTLTASTIPALVARLETLTLGPTPPPMRPAAPSLPPAHAATTARNRAG